MHALSIDRAEHQATESATAREPATRSSGSGFSPTKATPGEPWQALPAMLIPGATRSAHVAAARSRAAFASFDPSTPTTIRRVAMEGPRLVLGVIATVPRPPRVVTASPLARRLTIASPPEERRARQ